MTTQYPQAETLARALYADGITSYMSCTFNEKRDLVMRFRASMSHHERVKTDKEALLLDAEAWEFVSCLLEGKDAFKFATAVNRAFAHHYGSRIQQEIFSVIEHEGSAHDVAA